ncbi:TolB family protein [Mongoliibacter ruber]|uniref:WD40 repeat protein n=1 Tax=Mongoliibacter ruber TaxID=1750599 RepID=A0A2T0WUZ0_9BACT|nr:hypothetical protein [Mongoliibacter ruber]PRY90489.1 hypothetical protein CLW00_101150 [Mongoliibacter ruber]
MKTVKKNGTFQLVNFNVQSKKNHSSFGSTIELLHLRIQKGLAFFLILFCVTFVLFSCAEEEKTPPIANEPAPTGSILVKISTIGLDDEPDGYTLNVEGSALRQVEANGEYSIGNKKAGRYNVELTNISQHCTGNGNMIKEVTVTADSTVTVEFEVSCKAILKDRITYAKGLDNFTAFKFYSSKLDGSNEKVILDQVINFPSSLRISPDGTRISITDRVEGTNMIQVFVMDADGQNLEMIPYDQAANVGQINQFNQVWHPDGKKLTFRSGFKTVTYDLETGERKEFELEPGRFFSVTEVFENGNKFLGIYMVSVPNEPVIRYVATMNSDGSDLKLLKESTDLVFFNPRLFSGNTIVYLQRRNGPGFFNEFWQMNLDGTEDKNVSGKLGFAENELLQSFSISPDKEDLIFYVAQGLNFYFGKTKINGSSQNINFPERAIRINPEWSPATKK